MLTSENSLCQLTVHTDNNLQQHASRGHNALDSLRICSYGLLQVDPCNEHGNV